MYVHAKNGIIEEIPFDPPYVKKGGKNMKNNYKEVRRISACTLRQLCINMNWYTLGNNDEYGHLLLDLAENKENLSTADIIEIAEDILIHSELEPLEENIYSIAYEVARKSYTFFVKI